MFEEQKKKLVNLEPEDSVLSENAVYCFPNTIVSGNNAFYEKIWFTMQ